MGLIVFEVHTKGRRTTKNQSVPLMWYEWAKKDASGNVIEKGKMHTLHGGRLDYRYDFDAGKMNVGVAPLKITSYETESNDKEINEWVKAHGTDLGLTVVSGVGITVVFPDKNKEQVRKALDDTNFTYEII